MPSSFANKTILITGGASGIGLATARILARRNARLVIWDVNAPALDEVSREFQAVVGWVDVSRRDQVESAIAQIMRDMGSLDGVIHCAGILTTGMFEAIDIDVQRKMVDINLSGTLLLAYAALPHLKATRGSLVFLSSVSAFYGPPEFAAYGATKAAVLNFAQALQVELTGTGVHIGVVCPHFVDTPLLNAENRQAKFVSSKSAFVKINRPNTIANAIIRGIEDRRFMIYPGWRPRVLFWLSRYAAWAAGRMMTQAWRNAGGKVE